MRFPIISPGRVGDPYLEPGDAVALADRHGCLVGEWVQIVGDLTAVRLQVPDNAGPVKCYLARDQHGRIQWWSGTVWHPPAMPGQFVHLPLRRDMPRVIPAERSPAAQLVRTLQQVREGKPRPITPQRPVPAPPPASPFTQGVNPVRWSSQ